MLMAMGSTLGVMAIGMKGSGNSASNMATELTFLPTEIFILAIIIMGSLMAMDSIYGQLVVVMLGILKMDLSMVRASGK